MFDDPGEAVVHQFDRFSLRAWGRPEDPFAEIVEVTILPAAIISRFH